MAERTPRHHDIDTRAVIATLTGLGATIIAVCVVAYALARYWETPKAGPNAPVTAKVPQPALQSAPQFDSARYLAEKERVLERYEWIDRKKGIARIPIDAAMQVLAGDARADAPRPHRPSEAQRDVMSAVLQHPGATLPLDTRFTDESGRETPLAAYFGRVPVVLVFGYYRCPNLCSTLMESVLVASSATKLSSDAYRVVGVSIDPREGAGDATEKARAYRAAYDGAPLDLLTGSAAESARVADAAGVQYAYDSGARQYSHPLTVLIVAPDGRISRYFAGVQLEPRELRLALIEASAGDIGSVTERIFLRCAHFDPATGRYSVVAMTFVRGGSLLCTALLGVWVWRRRKA